MASSQRALTKIGALALAAVCSLAPAPGSAGDDARDIARAIYRAVERACPLGGEGNPYNLREIADRHFTPDLRDLLAEAYQRHSIDFDVLLDAEDCEIRDVDIDMDERDDDDDFDRGRHGDRGGHAIARAEFRNFGEPRIVDLLLVYGHAGWKVADIAYGHRDWQLRRDLDHGERGYTK